MTDNNDSIDDAPIPEVPKKKTNKGGRPKKNLTDEQYNTLIAMIRIQCTQDELCRIWDMDSNTLDRIVKEKSGMGFSELYKKHCDEGKMSLRRLQWRKAQEGNTAMLIWLGKQMLGQRDKHDHGSEDGSFRPTTIKVVSGASKTQANKKDDKKTTGKAAGKSISKVKGKSKS